MLNLDKIVSGAISSVVPKQEIAIITYNRQQNNKTITTTIYNDPYFVVAQVQLANSQDLVHIQGINLTKIYKKFYIQSYLLTGLNRNLSTGGDYLVQNQIKYKIVSVVENFETGWVYIIGCQDVNN